MVKYRKSRAKNHWERFYKDKTITVGYTQDWTDSATIRVEIVAETTDGRYVLRRGISGLFLRPKEQVISIHEEEEEDGK